MGNTGSSNKTKTVSSTKTTCCQQKKCCAKTDESSAAIIEEKCNDIQEKSCSVESEITKNDMEEPLPAPSSEFIDQSEMHDHNEDVLENEDKEINSSIVAEQVTDDSLQKNSPSIVAEQVNAHLPICDKSESIPDMKQVVEDKSMTFSIAGKNLKLLTAEDVAEFTMAIEAMDNLEVVALNGNTLGVEASKALADALSKHMNIKEVNLNDCFTGRLKEEVPTSLKAFGDAFIGKEHLRKIDFSDNALGPSGAKALADFLSKCFWLEELRLNNNGLGPEGGRIVAEALIKCQEGNTADGRMSALRTIVIGRNRLENGSAPFLAMAIESHCLLENVSLPQNGIRPEGISKLSRSLAKCANLKTIDLQDNTFTDEASLVFADQICSWPHLGVLNIGDCLLGKKGSLKILESLVSQSREMPLKLQRLNLQYNEIDENGAQYLADNIGSFGGLISLMLNGNSFDPEGHAAKAIRSSVNMEEIIDSWSDMDYDSQSESEDSSDGSDSDMNSAEENNANNNEDLSPTLLEKIESLQLNSE